MFTQVKVKSVEVVVTAAELDVFDFYPSQCACSLCSWTGFGLAKLRCIVDLEGSIPGL